MAETQLTEFSSGSSQQQVEWARLIFAAATELLPLHTSCLFDSGKKTSQIHSEKKYLKLLADIISR